MTEEEKKRLSEDIEQKDTEHEPSSESETEQDNIDKLKKSLDDATEKYIRLYADFENYKKVAARNKEELLKYANEELLTDFLTVIDHLELALQHSAGSEMSNALAEGVQLTLKELKGVLEKHGLVTIDALGKPFDPFVHHAMSQIESEDEVENTVVKEFRKGYMLKDRVLRASLVGVAKKTSQSAASRDNSAENPSISKRE